MFEKLKKVLAPQPRADAAPASVQAEMGEWAAERGIRLVSVPGGTGFGLTGEIAGKPWKLESGASVRDYITGQEVRARAEIKVNEEPTVIVMNRALRETLEERAYGMYTDSLQTDIQPGLIEEMHWLASYPEVGWDSLPKEFAQRYAVMSDRRGQAMIWLVDELVDMLVRWPEAGIDSRVPFMVMLMRGKVHLRMQFTPPNLPTLAHAVQLLLACAESASASFRIESPIGDGAASDL